jgi:hypothetical protein
MPDDPSQPGELLQVLIREKRVAVFFPVGIGMHVTTRATEQEKNLRLDGDCEIGIFHKRPVKPEVFDFYQPSANLKIAW